MSTTEDKSWVWDNYWQANRLASCLAPGAENYSGAIAAFWAGVFERMDENADILDLCTGNGSVPLFAVAACRNLAITAVDQAAIAPDRFVLARADALAGINFVPGASVEDLPLPDACFDLVTSQYGVEYADLDAVASEIRRVLKPDGRVAFIVHAAEGAVAADAKEEVAACKRLIGELTLFETCRKALVGSERAANAFIRKLRKAGSANTPLSRRSIVQHMARLLDHTYSVRSQFPTAALLEKVTEAERETRAHMVRNELLVSAAKTADEVDRFLGHLGRSDNAVRSALHLGHGDRSLIGWAVQTSP